MSLKLNSSGGGSVTLQEPTTASNVTLSLPAADGTVVYENSSGNVGIGTSSPAYKLDVAGFARGGIVNRKGTYTAGTTTPSVSGISYMSITNSSSTTITNFTDGEEGQVIYLHFNDSNTTVNRSNAYLSGGANFVSTAGDTLTLVKEGLYWYEISRSANA